METIVQAVLTLVMLGVAVGAFRQYRRARLNPYSRALQQATLALCADVMADENNTAKARSFARQIALFTFSDTILIGLAKDHAQIRRSMEDLKRAGKMDPESSLSDVDREVVKPLLHVFAMTCLLHNPKYSPQIRKLWEEVSARSYARANAGGPSRSRPMRPASAEAAAPKPVQEKLHRVEDEVLERLMCVA